MKDRLPIDKYDYEDKTYYVYILYNNKKIVYCGMSHDILNRIKSHKNSSKDFDEWQVIFKTKDFKKASFYESGFIMCMTIFNKDGILNKSHKWRIVSNIHTIKYCYELDKKLNHKPIGGYNKKKHGI